MNKATKNDKKMRQICSVPIDLIYPPVCGICGKLCNEFLCKKCSIMLRKQARCMVDNYGNDDKNFDEHLYIFKYEGIIRKIILKYKFQNKSYLYKTFVNFLLKDENLFEILEKYDTIIPVPISRKRQKQRGYNQSELLAREIAEHTNLKYENLCLFKTKDIIEQSKLNKEERIQNIQGAYELKNPQRLTHKKILLLDDIYTTGSTVDECCRILREAEPRKLGVLTIAKD